MENEYSEKKTVRVASSRYAEDTPSENGKKIYDIRTVRTKISTALRKPVIPRLLKLERVITFFLLGAQLFMVMYDLDGSL